MSGLTFLFHAQTEDVCIFTVKRKGLEVAELLQDRKGRWYMWRTLNPLWNSLELREIADKLDTLNLGVHDEVQVPLQGGDAQ